MVDHHEKIVELRREHLLETVQNHVVERFDQVVDRRCKVRSVLLSVGDLKLERCDVSNDVPNHFSAECCNHNHCMKTRSMIFRVWCVHDDLNFPNLKMLSGIFGRQVLWEKLNFYDSPIHAKFHFMFTSQLNLLNS